MHTGLKRHRFFFLIVLLGCSVPIYAQTGYLPLNPIVPPTIQPPALFPTTPVVPPVVTAPSPIAPATDVSPSKAQTEKKTTETTTKTTTSSLPQSLSELTSPVSLLNALSASGEDTEGIEALSSLLTGGTSLTGSQQGSNAENTVVLNKILSLLEKQQASDVSEKKKAGSRSEIKSGGEIVRFTVNGYTVVTATAAFASSSIARDGSFLLTGNRTYAGNEKRTETYYMLCKKTGTDSYRLYVDVTQDYKNENSFLYQLVRRTPITGTLTGDLLVFRTVDQSWALDLVIRVIIPSGFSSSVR